MHVFRLISIPVAGLLVCTSGCGWVADQIASSLAEGRMKRMERSVVIPRAAQGFADCMKTRGSECPLSGDQVAMEVLPPSIEPPVEPAVFTAKFQSAVLEGMQSSKEDRTALQSSNQPQGEEGGKTRDEGALKAVAVLFDPVHQKLASVYDRVKKRNTAGLTSDVSDKEEQELKFTYKELKTYRERIEDATISGGWGKLQRWSEQKKASVAFKDAQNQAQMSLLERIGRFSEAYLSAYFRNGEFATFKVDVNKVKESLKKDLGITDDKTADAIFKVIFANNYKPNPAGYYFGSIGRVAFISRGGGAYQFPALESRITIGTSEPLQLPTVHLADVGADLARIILEATFDATFGVPAVSNATGTKVGQDGEAIALKVFNPKQSAVSEAEFGMINELANQIEAGVGTAVGQAIRGAGPISLNNEALAKLIETLVGVTIRKTTEKVAWCLFACKVTNIPDEADKEKALVTKGDAFDRLEQAKLTIVVE